MTSDKNITRSSFFWNAVAAFVNGFQTMVLLIVLARCKNPLHTDLYSSIFVFAYAVANLMTQVGKYGVRQFQVTDIRQTYSFSDYLTLRCVTVFVMLLISFLYVLCFMGISDGSTLQEKQLKMAVVLLICFIRAVEAFEDVFHGRLQQIGRLDIAGRILGLRLLAFVVLYALCFFWTQDLLLTTGLSFLATCVLAVMLNLCVKTELQIQPAQRDPARFRTLVLACAPLCLSTCLNIYVANAPKYIIDSVVDSAVQTKVNIVFMPVFVVALVANFIFQPLLKDLGMLWQMRERSKFRKRIGLLALLVAGLTFLAVLGAYFHGVPVLGKIYSADLSEYRTMLLVFVAGSGLVALHNLMIMVITIMRRQRYMIFGYIGAACLEFFFGRGVLVRYGLMALCIYFTFVMTLLLLYFLGIIVCLTDSPSDPYTACKNIQ